MAQQRLSNFNISSLIKVNLTSTQVTEENTIISILLIRTFLFSNCDVTGSPCNCVYEIMDIAIFLPVRATALMHVFLLVLLA